MSRRPRKSDQGEEGFLERWTPNIPDFPSVPEGYRPEALAIGSALVGWMLLTAGLHVVLGSAAVWLFSFGLLAATAAGWRPITAWVVDGAYGAYLEATEDETERVGRR